MTYLSGPSGKYLQNFVIPEVYMNKWLDSNNVTEATKQDFLNFLNSKEQKFPLQIIEQRIQVEYSTLDADYDTAHKEEFETLAKNGFERLATIGAQGDNLANEGEIVKDFEGAKILFGFKTPMEDIGLSTDMGNVRYFNIYSLINKGESLELVKLRLVGKDTWAGWKSSATESVLQNKSNAWRIYNIERHEIEKENIDIFREPIMTIGKETNLSKE